MLEVVVLFEPMSWACIHAMLCFLLSKHYENMPMQYTEKFFGCKNENFSLEKF